MNMLMTPSQNNDLYDTQFEEYYQTHDREQTFLIDLRSEKEFMQGHIPHAINIPLLNTFERHLVGFSYKQKSKLEAIELGLEIFAKKSSHFCEKFYSLQKNHKNKQHCNFVLYCARGGMRSKLSRLFLIQLGFKVSILQGGYKSFRKFVTNTLEQEIPKHFFVVLNGNTGSGKTYLLQKIKQRHLATIDFEDLAKHRGSAFGDFGQTTPSPTQEHFDNLLYFEYLKYKKQKIIFVELENAIGPIKIHPRIHKKLLSSPMIFVERNFDERVACIEKEYASSWSEEHARLFEKRLQLLQKKLSKEQINTLKLHTKNKDLRQTISNLLTWHYDKRYEKSLTRHKKQMLKHFNLSTEEDKAISYIQEITHS